MTTNSSTQRINLIRRYPIPAFFVIAYAFSWAIGGLLIARHHGLINVPQWLHYLSAFGPAMAALIVTGLSGGRPALRDLWSRVVRTRIEARWWLIGVGMPILLGMIAVAVYWVGQGHLPGLGLFGQVDYLGDIGAWAALALWIATYGFGEEIGWRGYAFHHLDSGGGRWVRAAGIIGVLWGLWHLPVFFYKENFMALGVGGFVGFLISVTMGSILLSWIYRGGSHSILLVAIWHGLFDFVSASPVAEGIGNAIISGVVIVWVIGIIRAAARQAASQQEEALQAEEFGGSAPTLL